MAPPNMPPMMPPQGGPGGAPPATKPLRQRLPPQALQPHLDPNNPIQAELMQRADTITPQDVQALRTGISPQASAVIRRLLPEIGFLIDMLRPGAGGAPPAGQSAPPPPAPAQPSPPLPSPAPSGAAPAFPPRPASRLNQV